MKMVVVVFTIRMRKVNGLKISLIKMEYFQIPIHLSLSELLVDESNYLIDLNKDGNIGDTITSVLCNSNDLGLYRTVSESLIIDNSGLGIGDSSVSPTLLMNQ